MSDLSVSGVALRGVSASVPKNRVDNAQLESLDPKSKKDIIETVGIRYRHVAPDGATSADLCQAAATELLEKLQWNAEDIGLLVFVTQTPDHIVPGTATQLQYKLGLPTHALSLDINQGCAGYVYGMSVIAGMMKTFQIRKALLLVGDTITKMVSKQDNSIWPIFADAGSASAFELDESAEEMTFRLGSIGADFEAIHVPHGGFRFPSTKESLESKSLSEGIVRNACQLAMNGQAVFTFGLSKVASTIKGLMETQNIQPDQLDFLVLHQANQFLNDAIGRKTGFGKEKTPSSLHDFGNTSCATIPLTMVTQLAAELQSNKQRLLLSGFGVGLSWGNVLLTTNKVVCPELIYV